MKPPTKQELLILATDLLNEDPDTTEGICHECGETQSGCEPDAQAYECETCGECGVFGAQETLIMFA